MADQNDFLEAIAGTVGDEGDIDLDEHQARLLQRLQRDALLCLVDCQASMFKPAGGSSTGSATASVPTTTADPTTAVKVEKESSPSRGRAGGDVAPAAPASTSTAFDTAMRCILKLYQEKIVSSDKDLLGLVLFNTAEKRNPFDFPGVYILHPFNLLGADSVQEVEQLIAAGVPDSPAYKQFLREAGHRPSTAPSTLSDALWAAQHMFCNVRSRAIKYRRIFVFTDDDEPTAGSAVEYRRCCARARDLYEAGVAIEVFGMGRSSVKEEPQGNEQRASHSAAGGSGPSVLSTALPPVGSLFASLGPLHALPLGSLDASSHTGSAWTGGLSSAPPTSSTAGAASATPSAGEVACFAKHRFWEPLLRDATATADANAASLNTLQSDASLSTPQHYAGAVYVSDLMEVLDVVRRKVHPQRPFLNTCLQIGLRSDGGVTPRMAVSVYVPLMRAEPPKTEWLEGSTNTLIKRRTRYVKRVADGDDNANEEDDTGGTARTASVRTEETCYTTMVGGHHVFFTTAERARLTEVAAAGAEAGLFIVCFKAYEDVIQHKHVTERSAFVHANLRQGGPESVRLFTQLVRTLRKKGRVAIALYRMREASKPKLVALIPSPDLTTSPSAASSVAAASCVQFPVTSLAAEGLGFYLLPLPFADDLRQVPVLETTTSVSRGGPVKLEAEAVKPADVALAREVVRHLTVDYDITAVPNPALQLLYQNLQDMALRDLASGANGGALAFRSTENETAQAVDTVLTRVRVEDFTLPDEEGMKRYATLFHDFNVHVLGSQYDADSYCPLPGKRGAATAAGGASRQRRRGPSAESEGGNADAGAETTRRRAKQEPSVKTEKEDRDDEDRNPITLVDLAASRDAWDTLTVPQLKEYIKAVNGGPVANKKKADLIVLARSLYKK